MHPNARIFVAGHRGLVGSALVRALTADGHADLILRGSRELDLRDPAATDRFFADARPEYVFLAAARVGGIMANYRLPVDFLADNLAIQNNVIGAAHRHGTRRLLFLGSSCIYPRLAPQPLREASLLTGPLEPSNRPYAIAKIAGIELIWSYNRQYGTQYTAVMPTNLYGPGDNYDLETAHVVPALIRRLHEANQAGDPSVTLWGSGLPRREFLHVDDLAAACLHLLNVYDESEHINVGTGEDITIADLADLIAGVVGYTGSLTWDATKPDGTPRKLLDGSRIGALGWQPRIGLRAGLEATFAGYLSTLA